MKIWNYIGIIILISAVSTLLIRADQILTKQTSRPNPATINPATIAPATITPAGLELDPDAPENLDNYQTQQNSDLKTSI